MIWGQIAGGGGGGGTWEIKGQTACYLNIKKSILLNSWKYTSFEQSDLNKNPNAHLCWSKIKCTSLGNPIFIYIVGKSNQLLFRLGMLLIQVLNSLQNDKILDRSKLKVFADDISNVAKTLNCTGWDRSKLKMQRHSALFSQTRHSPIDF